MILTSNKNSIPFFQSKAFSTLWNYVDMVTSFKIVDGHLPRKTNVAADFISRLQSDHKEAIELKHTVGILVREMEPGFLAKLPDDTVNELFADDLPD